MTRNAPAGRKNTPFLNQSMYHTLWLYACSNGARLVCNHADIQRRVGGCIYSLFLSAAISHFIYRRRMGRPIPQKKLIIGADLLIAFVTFVMVLAIPHISSEPALLGGLLVMSVIRSLGAGIQTPAVNAVIPQLVPEDQLMRYNGINATMQSIVNFAAPAAAGAVFAISTLRMTLMIDIVTAILGTGLLSCLALPKQNTSIEKASVFSDMKIGVKYAFADKLIGKLLIIYGLFTFFCVPAGYLAGLLVRRVFGDTYWYLTAVEVVGFAGMMAGGVIMSTWGGFKHRGKTLAVGLFAFGSFAIGMGFSKNFIFYLGLMVCYGVALTMVQTAITTMLQEKRTPLCRGVYLDYLARCMLAFYRLVWLCLALWLIFFPCSGL